MAKSRKSGPKSGPKSVPSHQRPLDREPRPNPTGPPTQRKTNATRTRTAQRKTYATRTQRRGRRHRVRTGYTNTRSHATPAKKTPSPDNMVLEFDSNLNPSDEPLDKKYSRKYSPTKANAIRDRHNKLHELYNSEDFRKKVLQLHTPPSPPLSPGRTQKKYINPVEQAKIDDKQPRYISKNQYKKEIEEKKLYSKIPLEAGISQTRIGTPKKKNQSKKVKFKLKPLVRALIALNSLKRENTPLKIRSDDLTEKRLKLAQESASEPLSQEVINRRTLGIKMPGTPTSPITMVSTPSLTAAGSRKNKKRKRRRTKRRR